MSPIQCSVLLGDWSCPRSSELTHVSEGPGRTTCLVTPTSVEIPVTLPIVYRKFCCDQSAPSATGFEEGCGLAGPVQGKLLAIPKKSKIAVFKERQAQGTEESSGVYSIVKSSPCLKAPGSNNGQLRSTDQKVPPSTYPDQLSSVDNLMDPC